MNAVRIPLSILTSLLTLVVVLLGFQLSSIVGLNLILRFGASIALVALDLRIFPKLRRFSGGFAIFTRLFTYGGWVTVTSIVGPIILYLDRFLIASLLSISAVSYYTVPFEVISRLWIIPGSLVMTLFPAFSALGTTPKEKLQLLYVRAIKYLLLGTGPIVLILVMFANNILRLWLGAEFAQQSTLVFQLLLLGALVGLLAPILGSLLQGLGRPDILAKLYLIEVPLNIGLVWLLVQYFGIAGAALSFALRALIETGVLFVISARLIHLPYACVVENGLWQSVAVLLGIGGLLWMISFAEVFLFQIGFVIVLVLAFAVISWRYVLDETDKKVITSATPKFLFLRGGW